MLDVFLRRERLINVVVNQTICEFSPLIKANLGLPIGLDGRVTHSITAFFVS